VTKFFSVLSLGVLLLCAAAGAGPAPVTVVTAQILDFEKGYLFLTTGDGFKVATDVVISNGPVVPPRYARVTFDANGMVTKIEVSRTKLPPEGDLTALRRYAVSLSPFKPDPDLVPSANPSLCARTVPGKHVLVAITVQIPPTTPLTDDIYMTTDQSGWNPQAYKMDRVDALHYRTVLRLNSGTMMRVLFDRGSMQSLQVAENGIQAKPMLLCIGDSDAQDWSPRVYKWADQISTGTLPVPQTMPTPYNPAPFPNLPTPPPFPTHAPLSK